MTIKRTAASAGLKRGALLASMSFCALSTVAFTPAAHAQALLGSQVAEWTAPASLHRLSDLPADQRLELAISLPLRDETALDAFLAQLQDRASPAFRHYLSVGEFTRRYAPSDADYQAVLRFAAANHLSVRNGSASHLVIDVSGRVADIESAFHVRMGLYAHPTESRSFYAPDRAPTAYLNVPLLHVSGLDDYVQPVSHFIAASAQPQATGTGSGPNGSFLGSDIRAAYYGGTALTGAGQSVGLLELGSYNPADVQNYFTQVKQPLNVPVVGVSVNGVTPTCSSRCADAEQVLDIEEAISMAPGLSKVLVYVGNSPASILARMASDDSCAQLSSSWGWQANARVIDPILKQFQAQGQTFVDATGDDGYQLARGVVWPADDANVTAVGGTTLVTAGAGGAWQSEAGWTYSGGGPSPNGIAIPSYQIPFINAANQGSTTLRNVPDIAGVADNFYSCYDNTCNTGNGGTSYAAPLWAGFIALVNQQAASSGHAVVGFLNPTLYTLGAGANYAYQFHDQTSGNNGKYNAVTGFDLVTGFGSPQGQTMINALINGS